MDTDIEYRLWSRLRSSYCLTSAAKAYDEEPDCLEIGKNKLYYDEGNEEIKVINADHIEKFWNELHDYEKQYLLKAFDQLEMGEH